jgi:hypothetical protein
MALSSLLANDVGARPGYSNGYRIFDYANDPSTIRYKQYADEARARGITDPTTIHQYAIGQNLEWGGQHGIKDTDIKRGKIGLGAITLGGLGAYGLGASGAAAGAGELGGAAGSSEAGLGSALFAPGEATGGAGAVGGAAGAGTLDEAAMTQAAREQALQSLSSQGITSSASAGAAPGSALSRILDGSASTADWLSAGGNLASTGLGIAGSRRAANAYGDLNRQYMEMGAPSRARYEASMSPGFDPTTIPGYSGALDTASKGILARLSASGGNPYGNPGGLVEANRQIVSGTALPAIDAYQRLNAGTGGYAGFNAAAPGMATNQIGAQGGIYNAVGSGLAGLLSPQPSLLDTLRGLGVSGLS